MCCLCACDTRGVAVTEDQLQHWSSLADHLANSLPQLKHLALQMPNAPPDGFVASLAQLTSLSSLRIVGQPFTAFNELALLTQLTSFYHGVFEDDNDEDVRHVDLSVLAPLGSSLKHLTLPLTHQADLETVLSLLTSLEYLNAGATCQSGSVPCFEAMQHLRSLVLPYVRITGTFLQALARAPQLTYLVLIPDSEDDLGMLGMLGVQAPQLPQVQTFRMYDYISLNEPVPVHKMHDLLTCFPNLRCLDPCGGITLWDWGSMEAEDVRSTLEKFQYVCKRVGSLEDYSDGIFQLCLTSMAGFELAGGQDESQIVIVPEDIQETVMQALAPLNQSKALSGFHLSARGALTSTAVQAMVNSLSHISSLSLSGPCSLDLDGLQAIASLKHLKHLDLPELPSPARSSFDLIETGLGCALTSLAFKMPKGDQDLGLPAWDPSKPATFPNLVCFEYYSPMGKSVAHPTLLTDMHYLLHAMPELAVMFRFGPIGLSGSKGTDSDSAVEVTARLLSDVLQRISCLSSERIRCLELMFMDGLVGAVEQVNKLLGDALSAKYGRNALHVWHLKLTGVPGLNGNGIATPAGFDTLRFDQDTACELGKSLKGLKSLELECCAVQPLLTLPNIARYLPQLEQLRLCKCVGVTPVEVGMFAHAAPNVSILIHDCPWWSESDTFTLVHSQVLYKGLQYHN